VRSSEEKEVRDLVGKPWPGLVIKLKRYTFNVAVVMAGTNDIGRGRSAEAGNNSNNHVNVFLLVTLFIRNTFIMFMKLKLVKIIVSLKRRI